MKHKQQQTKPYVQIFEADPRLRRAPYVPETDPRKLLFKNTGDRLADQSARLNAMHLFAREHDWNMAAVAARSIKSSHLAVNGILHLFPHTKSTYDLAGELAEHEKDPLRRDALTEAIYASQLQDEVAARQLQLDLYPDHAGAPADTMVAHGDQENLPDYEKSAV